MATDITMVALFLLWPPTSQDGASCWATNLTSFTQSHKRRRTVPSPGQQHHKMAQAALAFVALLTAELDTDTDCERR